MDVAIALRRIVRERAVETVLKQSARGVAVRQIAVECAWERDAWMLDVEYSLSAPSTPVDGRALLVDASGCPLEIESRTCASATPDSLQPATSRTWLLRLRPGIGSWHDLRLQFRLRWHRAAGARTIGAVSVPDDLPRILSPGVAAQLPIVGVDAGPAGLQVHGLARSPERFGPEQLQAVLVPLEGKPYQGTPSVQVFGRLGAGTGTGERERVAHLIGNLLDHHSAFWGVPVLARVAVLPAEQLPGSGHGALLSIRSLRAFGLGGQDEPDDVMLGSRLAGLWWGAGCRISGPRRRELEAALRGVAGMMWADYVEGPYRTNVLDEWEKNAARSRILDWWAGAQGDFRHALQARWSLQLYHAVRRDVGIHHEVKRLTARAWGRLIPEEEVLAWLRRAGVPLT